MCSLPDTVPRGLSGSVLSCNAPRHASLVALAYATAPTAHPCIRTLR